MASENAGSRLKGMAGKPESPQGTDGSGLHGLQLCARSNEWRPWEHKSIEKAFNQLKEKAGLPDVVFHSLRHSSTTYKLKLNHGDLKATQGDTGHAQIDMITQIYAHILDEDRRVNAQRFEAAFYAKPDLRKVEAPVSANANGAAPTPIDAAALIEQIKQSPELLATLALLIGAKN